MGIGPPQEEAYREFVAARYPALLRTAYLLGGDWATAEDLVQTALAKTYIAWRRIDPSAVEAYTRRVLVNTATSFWRAIARASQATPRSSSRCAASPMRWAPLSCLRSS